MEQNRMLYCENCHALIEADDAKCPYCGALNLSGGEKKYMESLFDLKEDVEELSSVSVKAYRKEFRKTGRMIKRALAVFIMAAAFCGILFFMVQRFTDSGQSVADSKAQLLWERENYPKLDALYEKGDYDGILEFELLHSGDENYSVTNWAHNDFISIYSFYLSCKEAALRIDSGDYDKEDARMCIMDAMFVIQERSYIIFSDKEQAQIDGYRKEVRKILTLQFGMQEEEIDRLYAECCIEDEYGTYLDYELAKKVIKSYVN